MVQVSVNKLNTHQVSRMQNGVRYAGALLSRFVADSPAENHGPTLGLNVDSSRVQKFCCNCSDAKIQRETIFF